jgi:putative aminopeptidase FrvX
MNESLQEWQLLADLCAVHAVAGREDRITRFVFDYVTPLADEVDIDNLGNVTAILRGTSQPEIKLMLQAHMDELGLIVRDITPDGYVLVERIGGVPEKSLLGQKVDILTDTGDLIPGIVGAKSHHITSPDEKFVVPKIHQIYIDLGYPTREAVLATGVQVGDPIAYRPNFERIGDGLLVSKSFDNRVSIYILLRILERLSQNRPDCTIIFAFTVLEEFSIRGSLPVVTRTDPTAILSLDITIGMDTPSDKGLQPVFLRHGPAIKMMDFHGRGTLAGLISSPPLRRFIEGIARAENIPLQREVIVGVITDPAFQLYQGDRGYAIAGISIPCRYTHSAVNVVHEGDVNQTTDLLTAAARSFNASVDLRRGF